MIDPRLRGATVVCSVSGGKDSAAMSLYLTELGIEHRRVFADTGWENDKTLEYIAGPLQQKIGPIETVKANLLFEDLVISKGMFPGRLHRYCSEQLKVVPIRDLILSIEEEVVNAVGIRAGESRARADALEWEWAPHFDCWTWRPILRWVEADVIAIHRRHGLAPNPLYLQGSARVGCWPCIFARKSEIRRIARIDPDRIETIRKLEAAVKAAAELRYEKRGETFESLGYVVPSLLLVPIPGTHRRRQAPIDEVIAWANTPDPKGREEDDSPPCARWGLCEAEPEPDTAEPEVDPQVELAVASEA